MIEEHAFSELVNQIKSLGIDENTAAHYAMLIGDTPCLDENGKTVVEQDNVILARLDLKIFRQ